MKKLTSILKLGALAGVLSLTAMSMLPAQANARVELDAAADRDCDATENTCFIRVGDDGDITVYDLGNLLAN